MTKRKKLPQSFDSPHNTEYSIKLTREEMHFIGVALGVYTNRLNRIPSDKEYDEAYFESITNRLSPYQLEFIDTPDDMLDK